MERTRRIGRALALVALGAVLATTVLAVAKKKQPVQPAKPQPEPAISIRDTGVGLPRIGSHGTLGIGEFTTAVSSYHDSGGYAADLAAVDAQAQAFMFRQARALRAAAKRRCARKKKPKPKSKSKPKPKAAKACPQPKLAITLDIDETSLSNYQELSAANFSGAAGALILAVGSADSPAIAPTLELYRQARANGIAVFAITGRPELAEPLTRQNLNAAGYTDLAGLFQKPTDEATIPFKSGARAQLEQQGYRIIANVGDQESDLAGGHADRSFKLPNPFYFIE